MKEEIILFSLGEDWAEALEESEWTPRGFVNACAIEAQAEAIRFQAELAEMIRELGLE